MKLDSTTKAAAPPGLQKHAAKRTQEVVAKLRAAMKTVESEIDAHEGIYPHNNGRLNQAEICRRASISNVTLSTESHRDTTKKLVDLWLKRIQIATVTGRKSVRRAVTDRADDWKRAHTAIAQSYRVAELELLDMRGAVQKLEEKLRQLEDDNSALRKNLEATGATKVVAFPSNQRK